MTKNELVRAVAKVLAGLQAPASIDPALLGAAYEPWQRAFRELNSFGWVDAGKLEEQLHTRLTPDFADEAAVVGLLEALESGALDPHLEDVLAAAHERKLARRRARRQRKL